MANVKISDLTEDTTPASGDFLESFDISASTSKKISIDNLLKVLMSSTGAWTSFTPTFTNLTVGNGTVASYYIKIGRTVHYQGRYTHGTTSVQGANTTVNLPVPASSNYGSFNVNQIIGTCTFLDTGVAAYQGWVRLDGASTLTFIVGGASGTYLSQSGITATIPFSWGSGDSYTWNVTYEAAS